MRKLLILLSLTLLAGCAVGPNFEAPTVEGVENYKYDTAQVDSMETLAWWELFNNPTIDSLVKMAMANNKDIAMAVARLDQAAAMHGFSRADMVPHINIAAGASSGQAINGAGTTNNFYVTPQLNWEIDVWGKLRRTKESSEASLIASDYGVRAVQLQVVSSVIENYINFLRDNVKLIVAKETRISREKSLEIMQARYDHGTIPLIDLNQSQIEYEVAVSAIESYKRLIKLQTSKLSVLLGEMPSMLTLEDPQAALRSLAPPTIPMGVNSQLIERRPDLMQQRYALKSQNAQVGVAIAQRFPTISLTGMLGLVSPELSSFTTGGPAWSVAGGLLGPLFQLNKTKYRVEVERAKTEEMVNGYEKSIISAFSDVEYTLVSISSYSVQDSSAGRKLDYAVSAEKLSAARYDKGVASYLEVLESERTLFSVALEYADIRASYLNSFIKLYISLGGGWISEEELNAETEAKKAADLDAKESGKEVEEPSDRDLRNDLMKDSKERKEGEEDSEKS